MPTGRTRLSVFLRRSALATAPAGFGTTAAGRVTGDPILPLVIDRELRQP